MPVPDDRVLLLQLERGLEALESKVEGLLDDEMFESFRDDMLTIIDQDASDIDRRVEKLESDVKRLIKTCLEMGEILEDLTREVRGMPPREGD